MCDCRLTRSEQCFSSMMARTGYAYSLLLKNATVKSKNKALEQRLVDKENSLDNMSEKRSMATCMTFVSVG
jgi:hypothetical protein